MAATASADSSRRAWLTAQDPAVLLVVRSALVMALPPRIAESTIQRSISSVDSHSPDMAGVLRDNWIAGGVRPALAMDDHRETGQP